MRIILYLLLLLFFLGCKKEDNSINGQLQGTWIFKESVHSSGYLPNVVRADPRRLVKLVLKRDGTFSLDVKPQLSPLQSILFHFDRYEILPDEAIRFYSNSYREGVVFQFELDEELELYRFCREACADYFVKR